MDAMSDGVGAKNKRRIAERLLAVSAPVKLYVDDKRMLGVLRKAVALELKNVRRSRAVIAENDREQLEEVARELLDVLRKLIVCIKAPAYTACSTGQRQAGPNRRPHQEQRDADQGQHQQRQHQGQPDTPSVLSPVCQ